MYVNVIIFYLVSHSKRNLMKIHPHQKILCFWIFKKIFDARQSHAMKWEIIKLRPDIHMFSLSQPF